MNKDSAFSGLEAAIVLIAFVVVAAVFSYVMLGAGFFATQKSQEVTYSGIKQTTSNVVLDGMVYGDSSPVEHVTFNIAIPEGGQPQLLSTVKFVTSSSDQPTPNVATVEFRTTTDVVITHPHVMAPGDKVLVDVLMDTPVINGKSFTIEMKPAIGAATLISRTVGTGYVKGLII